MWLFEPRFADGFVGCEALEGLEPSAEVVGGDKVAKMLPELVMIVVVVALDGRFLDGAVHPFDLPVGPRMTRLSEPMIDIVLRAGEREGVAAEPFAGRDREFDLFDRGARILRISEVDAVVGEHSVHLVRDSGDEVPEEVGRDPCGGLFMQFNENELRGPVDRDQQVEPAFLGTNFGDVDGNSRSGSS